MMALEREFTIERWSEQCADHYKTLLCRYTRQAEDLAAYAGCTFDGGLYHLYNSNEINCWTVAVADAFPDYRGRILAFGRDWLCNQFCLDRDRLDNGEAQILLFEIVTGDVLKIPASFRDFHEDMIVEDPDAALVKAFYDQWRCTLTRPLRRNECAGYRIPLLLGGQDRADNLEVTDAEVYWYQMAQIISQTGDMPDGNRVAGVRMEE